MATDHFDEVSESFEEFRIAVSSGGFKDHVWIGVTNNGERPRSGLHFPNSQAVRIATAILKAAGVDNVEQAPVAQEAKSERVKYVNNNSAADEDYVGQVATVIDRYASEVRLRFNDGREYWTAECNAVSVTEIPRGFLDDAFFEAHVEKVFADAQNLLLKKHRDYGPTNISRSPGGPLNGLRVRLWDKIARINNLIDSGSEPENESLQDSFTDLLNYSAIALLVLDGNWPEA